MLDYSLLQIKAVVRCAAIGSISAALYFFAASPSYSDEIFRRCGRGYSGFVSTPGSLNCIKKDGSFSNKTTSYSSLVNSTGFGSGSGYSPSTRSGSGYSPSDRSTSYSTPRGSNQSGNLYGPRGGCYRLNSKGNKDYSKC